MSSHSLEGRSITIPDLDWTIDQRRLICAVYDAVQEPQWEVGHRSLETDPTPDRVLQSLLTYCFAVGIVGSEEVAAACRHDPAVRYIGARYAPKWETIRDFRRRQAEPLKHSLATLFQLLSEARCAPAASADLQRLATERLTRAMQADSHALDF